MPSMRSFPARAIAALWRTPRHSRSWSAISSSATVSGQREPAMNLIAYMIDGHQMDIRPAPLEREWMDATGERFAYRCLPLNIANAHGWEILTPFDFEARWSGGASVDDVTIRLPAGAQNDLAPVSLFGQGVLTFHIFGLFRTPPEIGRASRRE